MSDFDVTCEWIGEYYDDVLVYFEYDKREVAAIRGLLSQGRALGRDLQGVGHPPQLCRTAHSRPTGPWLHR